jgi:glutaminase
MLDKTLELILEEVSKLDNKGENASYIPILSKQDPNIIGISIVDCNGNIYNKGDSDKKIPMESISKVFTLAMLLNKVDIDEVASKIGLKPSFLAFNSVMTITLTRDHKVNPFVNNGAIATTSLLRSFYGKKTKSKILNYFNLLSNNKLTINKEVYVSEMKHNGHNLGLTYLLDSWGGIYSNVEESVKNFTEQCSIGVTSEHLAIMAACLANKGIHPITSKKVIASKNIKYILSLMLSEGLYQESGKWSIYVGVPAKSGVGGGIIMVVPGKYGIGIVSPPLNKAGNSYLGWEIAKRLSERLDLNIFEKDDQYT